MQNIDARNGQFRGNNRKENLYIGLNVRHAFENSMRYTYTHTKHLLIILDIIVQILISIHWHTKATVEE